MFIKSVYAIMLCVLLNEVKCYNILGIFPHAGKSHFDVFQPLLTELSEREHNVTVLSYFPQVNSNTNYTDIDLTVNTSSILLNTLDMNFIVNRTRMFKYLGALPLVQFAEESCEALGSSQVQEFVNSNEEFDLIIIEMFTTDCFLGLVHHFKAPFIGVTSSVIMPWMNERFGNIDHPAYIPVMFMDFSDRMSFVERLENTIVLVLNKIIHKLYYGYPGHTAAKKYISSGVPPLEEIARNASLFLVNSHFSLNLPRPLVPSVIEVGGMHLKAHEKLPQVS